jgi:hypothetical protein
MYMCLFASIAPSCPCRTPLQKMGGMMTLTDVYCLYNRARGTELISPEDLLEACQLFPAVGAGLHVREFPSYVPRPCACSPPLGLCEELCVCDGGAVCDRGAVCVCDGGAR